MKVFELYRMVMGDRVWRFTSSDKMQFYDAGSGTEPYTPIPIKRSKTEQRSELARLNLDVDIPIEHDLAVELLIAFSEQIMSLTVFTNTDDDVLVTWKGRLSTIKPGDAQLTLSFESIFSSLRNTGLRRKFSRTCGHALYGRGCRLNPEDFAIPATLSNITGRVLTVPVALGYDAGHFTGGMVRAADGTLSYITHHLNTQITVQHISYPMLLQFQEEGSGTSITLYPGCKHGENDCLNKFNNLDNFGGFRWMPKRNPTDGKSIV